MVDHALSFGAAADLYDRARPGYPAEALGWALAGIGDSPVVVDLGAGTGILTRALHAAGVEVIPVEPDAAMRDRLAAATAGLTALDGSAERIPLPDASVDAVMAGQAYHWFDTERAHPEIARVLRPGGIFAPLWNIRDERVEWVLRFDQIISGQGGAGGPGVAGGLEHQGQLREPDFGASFGPVDTHVIIHGIPHTRETLIDLVRSRSSHLTAPAEERARVEAQVHRLLDTHPELTGRTEFRMPYRTFVYRAVRREG